MAKLEHSDNSDKLGEASLHARLGHPQVLDLKKSIF